MSGIIRSAKSGSNWTSEDLEAYNIVIRNQSARAFFDGQDLPATLTGIDPEFVNVTVPSKAANDETHHLLTYLDLASIPDAGQTSAVHDFAQELLHMLGFEERGSVLSSRCTTPLHICGEPMQTAQTGTCLVHHDTSLVLLVVHEGTAELSAKDREPQIVAAAVAAFQLNNRNRTHLGMERKDRMSIPCLAMVGTRPVFYVVPVTQQLSTAVERGQCPEHTTEVGKCAVVGERRQLDEGMEMPDFRLEALKHFVLFRSLAKSLWSEFLAD